MKKLLISFIFAFILCITAAAENVYTFLYDVMSDGTAAITGVTGSTTSSIAIPSTIDGYTVTSLGNPESAEPLSGFENMKNISILQGVKTIGDHAFENNKVLERVALPESVKEIGDYAFSGCTSLKTIELENIQYLGCGAFAFCTFLERVTLTSLEEWDGAYAPTLIYGAEGSYSYQYTPTDFAHRAAFFGCTRLRTVTLTCPDIYDRTLPILFLNCTALETVTIDKFTPALNSWEFSTVERDRQSAYTVGYAPLSLTIIGADNAAQTYALNRGLAFRSLYQEAAVRIDGNILLCDQPALLVNSRTLVPLRAIFEALDAEVFWDGDTQTVTATKENVEIELTIGDYHMRKNGELIAIDVPGRLINSRTLVPLRAISEALSCDVQWNDSERTAEITTGNPLNPGKSKFTGIDISKANASADNPMFVPSYETMMESNKQMYNNEHYHTDPLTGYPNRQFISAAKLLCDAIYNFDYRAENEKATAFDRIKFAVDMGTDWASDYRNREYYGFNSAVIEKNIEKKIIAQAFFVAEPENWVYHDFSILPDRTAVKGYLYFKYDSFEDPAFNLELGKWYRTATEITFIDSYTPSSGVGKSYNIESYVIEPVPEDMLITE